MRISGLILQISGVLCCVLCVAAGIAILAPRPANPASGIALIIGAIIGGALLFGIGAGLRAYGTIALDIERTADATERGADALDRLVNRHSPQ